MPSLNCAGEEVGTGMGVLVTRRRCEVSETGVRAVYIKVNVDVNLATDFLITRAQLISGLTFLIQLHEILRFKAHCQNMWKQLFSSWSNGRICFRLN
jgi:hypothetical protein